MNINPCKLPTKNSLRPRLGSLVAVLAIGLLLAASSARADLFYFTSDHCSGLCGPQTHFGSVLLLQNGADVDVTVTMFNGNKFVDTGAGMPFLFDDAGISLTDIINISSNSPKPLVAAVGGMADGTGTWDWGIACPTCNGGSDAFSGPISFTVLGTTLAEMEVGHAVTGFGIELFAADILSKNGKTGDVDVNTPPVSTPDSGTTASLLGLAMVGLAAFRTKFRKA